MKPGRGWTLAVFVLAACNSSPTADPTSPPTVSHPSPANIAGEWIDTTTYPGRYVIIAHVTQTGATAAFTDTIYSKADSAYVFATASFDSAGVLGDTVIAGDCVQIGARPGQCVAGLDTAVVQGNTMAFVGNADNDVCPSNCALVRGTWTPPTPPSVILASDTLLAGVWVSDSVPWQITDPSCVGIIQYELTIGGPTDSDSAIYEGAVAVRMCGTTTFVQQSLSLGQEVDSVLTFAQIQPVPPTGQIAGNNFWLKAVARDTLLDVTPDSVNHGYLPPHFYWIAPLSAPSAPARVAAVAPALRGRRR